jgi:hypothetical protein
LPPTIYSFTNLIEEKAMSANKLSAVTTDVIESSGKTAKNIIKACRVGSARVTSELEQRWDRAFEQALPQLSAETAKNAANAQRVIGNYYSKGLAVAAGGADAAVNQFVKAAEAGVERAAANAALFEVKTGVNALSQLAKASLPAAKAARKLAARAEKHSATLVRKIAA